MPRRNIRIALMGVTGSGKSTFIQTASGQNVGIGYDLQSFTATVASYEFDHAGYRITLIDTPGFNDTTRSESEVLKSIADWLDYTYRNPPRYKLNGIIYLQSILDPRMYGSSLRNLKMFKDLVGDDPLKNVVLATTRWGQVDKLGDRELAEEHEEQLRTDPTFWAPMIKKGAQMARFEDTKESAVALIMNLVDKRPMVLQIQSELVDQQRALIDTTAGNTVNEEMKRLEQHYKAEIAKIQKEMSEAMAARDHDVQEALEQSKEDFQRKLEKLREEHDSLRYERRNESRRMQNELEQLRAAYEKKLGTQQLDFDETVEQLKAKQGQLREEQRVAMQKEIDEMYRKDKKERTVLRLFAGLVPVLGSAVLGLLGITGGGIGGFGL